MKNKYCHKDIISSQIIILSPGLLILLDFYLSCERDIVCDQTGRKDRPYPRVKPSSNTSRRRFPLLSALFFEKNTVFRTIPRTSVLRNLIEAMHYAVKPVKTSCEELQDGREARMA